MITEATKILNKNGIKLTDVEAYGFDTRNYNDKLKDGTRSYKFIDDWLTGDAQKVLLGAGFRVKRITTHWGAERLHVSK